MGRTTEDNPISIYIYIYIYTHIICIPKVEFGRVAPLSSGNLDDFRVFAPHPQLVGWLWVSGNISSWTTTLTTLPHSKVC